MRFDIIKIRSVFQSKYLGDNLNSKSDLGFSLRSAMASKYKNPGETYYLAYNLYFLLYMLRAFRNLRDWGMRIRGKCAGLSPFS